MSTKARPPSEALTLGQRTQGLNQITRLRAQYWNDDGKALRTFFNRVQDTRDPMSAQNRRALSALLFLAGIPASRHALPPEKLATEERTALVLAMNQLRAMVSLFPRRLMLPR